MQIIKKPYIIINISTRSSELLKKILISLDFKMERKTLESEIINNWRDHYPYIYIEVGETKTNKLLGIDWSWNSMEYYSSSQHKNFCISCLEYIKLKNIKISTVDYLK